MSDSFDFSELDEFEQDLLDLAGTVKNGKEAKRFLRNTGNKLKRRTIKLAKQRVNEKSGNLLKGIKRGKPYKWRGDGGESWAVRVYGGKPAYHAHLLEYGHRIVKNGKEYGFAKGYHFFEDAAKNFERDEWEDEVEKFIDQLLDEKGFY